MRSAPRWYSIRVCDGAARTFRTARRAAARRSRPCAAQRAREPAGALSDACASCRRIPWRSSCRAARARPRSTPSSTSIGSGSRTPGESSNGAAPCGPRACRAASICARSGRACDVEYRHEPASGRRAAGSATRCSRSPRRMRIGQRRGAPRSEPGCSTRPTTISRRGCCANRRSSVGDRRTCRCGLQRTRWGSCSNSGTVSLNAALLFVEPPLVRYLFVHELCHLIALNHSRRFWAAVARYEPGLRGARPPLDGCLDGDSALGASRARASMAAVKFSALANPTVIVTAIVYGFLLRLAECGRVLRLLAAGSWSRCRCGVTATRCCATSRAAGTTFRRPTSSR